MRLQFKIWNLKYPLCKRHKSSSDEPSLLTSLGIFRNQTIPQNYNCLKIIKNRELQPETLIISIWTYKFHGLLSRFCTLEITVNFSPHSFACFRMQDKRLSDFQLPKFLPVLKLKLHKFLQTNLATLIFGWEQKYIKYFMEKISA